MAERSMRDVSDKVSRPEDLAPLLDIEVLAIIIRTADSSIMISVFFLMNLQTVTTADSKVQKYEKEMRYRAC